MEASKAFQMEKVEQGYEIMSNFTVNLNREEKIIREIDFSRGALLPLTVGFEVRMCKSCWASRMGGCAKPCRMDVQTSTGSQTNVVLSLTAGSRSC